METKTLDSRLGLSHKWTKGRFVLDSGYYAGRPPSLSDLDSKILEQLYQGIKADVGKAQARNFVNLVNVLEDLSASAFIVAFEKFWSTGFSDFSVRQKKSDRTELSARGDAAFAQGLFALASAMGHRLSEAEMKRISESIKSPFIAAHRKELVQ